MYFIFLVPERKCTIQMEMYLSQLLSIEIVTLNFDLQIFVI